MAPHEQFLELCAASMAGELTGEERKKLSEHLKSCASCRRALEQFKISAKASIPAAADEIREVPGMDPSLPTEKAEAAFFARFDEAGGFRASETNNRPAELAMGPDWREMNAPSGMEWGQLWMPFVAIILFGLALGVASYRTGIRKGVETAAVQQNDGSLARLEEQLSDAGHEREQFRAEVAARDRSIAELRKEIVEVSAATQRKESGTSGHEQTADSQRIESAVKLEALQRQLDAEQLERSRQATRAAELEAKVSELSKQLQESQVAVGQQKRDLDEREGTINQQKRQLDDQEGTIGRQQELLAHDRDVRELMGARNLYVVEVYDVLGTGETNKPYGRLFYTKGQKLLFYAYDLDQAPGLKRARTFQAWGQRGPDKDRALNLGIFYEDNATNKRWVLKSNDPKTLAEIDAVFVTVEPDAHSHQPRGKEVLFAYLRIDPNHP
jgi:peptidoglycan hydrolase CwlO-like protein